MSKHPLDRRVFFTRQRNDFVSVNEIQRLYKTGELSALEFVFDTDGGQYTAGSIAQGKAPEWAQTTAPMLDDCPSLSAEDIAMADAIACEDGFLEMPTEPKAKTVRDFLAREPQIARLVANAGCRTL